MAEATNSSAPQALFDTGEYVLSLEYAPQQPLGGQRALLTGLVVEDVDNVEALFVPYAPTVQDAKLGDESHRNATGMSDLTRAPGGMVFKRRAAKPCY